ncbi:DUF3649 domain-containing protein [Methylobacillus arboreus]|uniref:DUF3649 domain-containing protein n=1 Tax=Methylobacillus arboreus TaxID=755170 RepID=UPI001E38EBE1|nr:DUF3649 domain-containing protein [Methylobacillus arboreus]MCB5190923.1 DUF3649 domain-containing protein [Methylobacillus arboreus]
MSSVTRYRLMVASRILAAVVAGYALTSSASILLALLLPIPKAEAVLASTMLSFAVYAGVVIWVFQARSATRAWVGLLLPLAVLSLLCWLLMPGGAA